MRTPSNNSNISKLSGKRNFYNLKLDVTSRKDAICICNDFLNTDRTHTLFFLNAHCFNVAQKNCEYKRALNESDLLLNDGIGIKLASLFAGIKIKENLNGTDLIPEILVLAAKRNKKIFFIGGKDGVAETASKKIKLVIPELQITGHYSGYFDEKEERDLLKKVNGSGAEILVLGMGVPRQELWASRNRDNLENIKIIIAGGAILDFLSGRVKRAPLWIRKLNLEWAYRLFKEPRRLWRRYIIGNLLFFLYQFRFIFIKLTTGK